MSGAGALLFLSVICTIDWSLAAEHKHDYCIVGAGPGGMQIGYFLHKSSRNYVIFEQSNTAGNFYVKYPRHRTLISVNKRYSGQLNSKFNMRHDWNSLLSDNPDLRFTKYTEEYYPKAEFILKYFNDFAKMNELNVQYNTFIDGIRRIDDDEGDHKFSMKDQDDNQYNCKVLIFATGLSRPNIPNMVGEELTVGYEDVSIDPKDFTRKNVLIIGRGNAAFETADAIYHEANFVHMMSRSRAKLAWSTHYVGDLRAINNNLLDNYQLKSLDGLLENPIEYLALERNSKGKIIVNVSKSMNYDHEQTIKSLSRDNYALRSEYDVVIRCTGFKSDMSVFHQSTVPEMVYGGKYPSVKGTYESTNVPDMYIAGAMGHGSDFRKSAGGFIHGYRYTARTLHRVLEARYHNKMWENTEYRLMDLTNTVVKRLNEADSLYQMFSTLGDVITIDRAKGTFRHFEDFPISMIASFGEIAKAEVETQNILVMNYEYGKNFSGPGKDTFHFDRAVGEASEAHKSNFLHPVFYYYDSLPTAEEMEKKGEKNVLAKPKYMHHIVEDFLTDFTAPIMHLLPLRRFFEHILQTNMMAYDGEFCLDQALNSLTEPLYCRGHAAVTM